MASITSPLKNEPRKAGQPNILQRLAFGIKGQELITKSITTLILAAGAVLILTPFLFMISTSLKDQSQLRSDPLSIIPRRPTTVELNGKQEPLYVVNLDGAVIQMALIKNLPGKMGQFVDPANPGQIHELLIADQKPIYHIEIHWENFHKALTSVPFDRYLVNTLLVVFLSMAGMLFSCTLVAYGFSRFRAPGLNILFLVLLSTIMLPSQVRLIPIYVMFQKLGWVDTLLPLIVPAFFANAYDVFL
jgi:multiple sugar transport system permease protein